MQLSGRKTQRLGDPQRGLERQRRIELRGVLAKLDPGSVLFVHPHLDDAGSGMLPDPPLAQPSERQQNRVSGHGRVSDERRLLAGIEEPEADVVIAGGGGGYEGYLRLRELTRDRHQGGIGLAVRVEHNGSRIAGETSASERVDLEYAQVVLRSQG